MSDYIYDQSWGEEKRRLDSLAALYDPGTVRLLEQLGVGGALVCLEVGAGSGTIARWVAEHLDGGRLVVTDIDTRFVGDLASEQVDVRHHDIVNDDLDQDAYDLIHSRAVLEHLPERDRVLDRLVGALRPGGWILLEDVVFPPAVSDPPLPVIEKVVEAFHAGFRAAGADPYYGLRLPGALHRAGLIDVGYDGRAPLVMSGTSSVDFMALSLEQLRGAFVAGGLLTDDEVDEALGELRTPGYTTLPPMMVAAWGRKPS